MSLQSKGETRPAAESALMLRKLLGQVRLQPTQGDTGRPCYRAVSTLRVLALLEDIPGEGQDGGPAGTTPEGGSTSFRWWTRRERCRTAGELRFDVPLLATEPAPLYQRIAKEASSLRYLGLSIATVAKHLRVDQKTAAKAIGWYGDRH